MEAKKIERPVARLAYTLVRQDGQIHLAGNGPQSECEREIAYFSVEAANGEILTIQQPRNVSTSHDKNYHQVQRTLFKYSSISAMKSGEIQTSWHCSSPVRNMAAFDSGFVVVYDDGSVATLGDPRSHGCLGRVITEDSPAETPGLVSDLADLADPVHKVAAGGYQLAALTESGSLYVWGTPPGGPGCPAPAFPTLTDVPSYIEVDGGKDIQDVALGDSHAIVLTTESLVYVLGDNSQGQIGLGNLPRCPIQVWTIVKLNVPKGHQIVAVAAGPRSSFVLTSAVKRSHSKQEK